MFRALPTGSTIEATPNRIVSLHRCLNSSPITLGGGPPVAARAHVVGVYNEQGTYTVYLVLTPVTGGLGLLFCCDPRQVPLAQYRSVEREALELVEGQGFVMEPVEIKHLSAGEVQVLLQALPIVAPVSGSSGTYNRGAEGGSGVQPLPRPRAGTVQARGPAAATNNASSQSRSGLYNLGQQPRATSFSSRTGPVSNATSQPPPAAAAGPNLRRTPTASFGRPPRSAQPNAVSAPPVVSGPPSGGALPRIPTGNVRTPRHGSANIPLGTAPGAPVPMPAHDDVGLSPEEAIALLGRLLALY